MARRRVQVCRSASVSCAVLLFACGGAPERLPGERLPPGTDEPSAGQTGSPVAPDHSSPGQFGPPVPAPPQGGASPTLPGRPQAPRRLTASFEGWLYVVTRAGLFAFDTRAPGTGSPAAQLLPQAAPRWIGVEGNALSVIASVLPDEPADVEEGQRTRLYRFDLSRDPGAPELLGSVDLPGELLVARLEPGRLLALSTVHPAPRCAPQVGLIDGWSFPERLVVSDLRAAGAGWSLAGSASAEAQGFIETEGAFVLVRGGYSGLPSALTVVQIGADALTTSAAVNVAGETLPRAALAVAGERLALFQDQGSGLELQVHSLSGGAPLALSLPVAGAVGDRSEVLSTARFDGRFVLVPAELGAPQPGVIADWQRPEGPAVTAQLPADLPNVERLDGRWLGWGPERSVVFRVGPEGTFDVERELGRPFDGRYGLGVHWDADTQQVLLPYLVTGSGIGSVPAAYALAHLELSSPSPAWRGGLPTAGSPGIVTYDRVSGGQQGLQLQRTSAGWFALTEAGEPVAAHRLLEALDLEASSSQVVGFAEQTLAASLSEHASARLLGDYRGTRAVSIRNTDDSAAAAEHVALGFGAERLERTADGWLSYSLTYGNACSNPELFPGAVCLPSGKAALSQLSSAPPALVHDTELPLADTLGTPPASVREWLEITAQGGGVGLLAHRDLRCTSESPCDGRASGNQNQRWLHPYDSDTGQFQAPVRLPDVDGHGWLSASGLRVEDEPAFVWLDPQEIAADGYSVVRARMQLLRFPSLLGASPENLERITVPGYPMYVSAQRAVSIEPAALLDASGASVGMRVHRLELRGGQAYLMQTLELPSGHAGHLWADRRGYVLAMGDDRCAQPSAMLIGVRLNEDTLEEAGHLQLPGTGWQLAQASDQLVLLTRTVGDLNQHALVDVHDAELTLRGLETRPASVQASVFADRIWFAP